MAFQSWHDDDELLGALAHAVREAATVPREFVEAGKAAYAWRTIDAELATLAYDSSLDGSSLDAASLDGPTLDGAAELALTREQRATLRALTFVSRTLTIEIEFSGDSLFGQIVPPQVGEVEARSRGGAMVNAPIDDIGCFVIQPVPPAPFRLRCRSSDGGEVVTSWIAP
jgi:hypothetical protein